MKYVKYLWAGIALLLGGFLFQRTKAKTAEALLENQGAKEEAQKIQAEKDKNTASLKLEEERREDIKKNEEDEKAKSTNDSDLLDFLNKSDKS